MGAGPGPAVPRGALQRQDREQAGPLPFNVFCDFIRLSHTGTTKTAPRSECLLFSWHLSNFEVSGEWDNSSGSGDTRLILSCKVLTRGPGSRSLMMYSDGDNVQEFDTFGTAAYLYSRVALYAVCP